MSTAAYFEIKVRYTNKDTEHAMLVIKALTCHRISNPTFYSNLHIGSPLTHLPSYIYPLVMPRAPSKHQLEKHNDELERHQAEMQGEY